MTTSATTGEHHLQVVGLALRVDLALHVQHGVADAVRLHEHPEYNFRGGRRGKWLELSLAERETAVRDVLIASVRRALP